MLRLDSPPQYDGESAGGLHDEGGNISVLVLEDGKRLEGQVITDDELIRMRQEELEFVLSQISLMQELQVDIAHLTAEQQEVLDEVEKDIIETEGSVQLSVVELGKARKLDRRFKTLKTVMVGSLLGAGTIGAASTVVVLMLVLGPIGLALPAGGIALGSITAMTTAVILPRAVLLQRSLQPPPQ